MSIWYEGSTEIETSMQEVKLAFENIGLHFVGVVRLMPGLTSVELVEQGSDFVSLRTNEGLMNRKSIKKRTEAERFIVEFDEEYLARLIGTVKSHYLHEFTSLNDNVTMRTVLSDVEAPGFLGFLYRKFGKSNIGNAVLHTYRTYFKRDTS